MDWKEYIKDYCEWCHFEIEWQVKADYPDLVYNGIVLKGNGKYWHSSCAQISTQVKNSKILTKQPK